MEEGRGGREASGHDFPATPQPSSASNKDVSDTAGERRKTRGAESARQQGKPSLVDGSANANQRQTQSGLGRAANDVSPWMDGSWEQGIARVTTVKEKRAPRLKALGNSVVPAIPEALGRMIIEAERT